MTSTARLARPVLCVLRVLVHVYIHIFIYIYISIQLFSNIVDSRIIRIPGLLSLPDGRCGYVRSLPTPCCNQTVYVGCLSPPPLCASFLSERNLRLSRLFL